MSTETEFPLPTVDLDTPADAGPQAATLAGGCFWCTEAVFERVDGVLDVTSGYAGGARATADYKSVCNGTTGHAEAIRITYDPARVSYGKLLQVFFAVAHDPTQLNRQGGDRGSQYRSAIFYETDEQRRVAEAYIKQLDDAGVYGQPIVTTLEPLGSAVEGVEFFEAEDYHQDFAQHNPNQPYVCAVALPKVAKLEKFVRA